MSKRLLAILVLTCAFVPFSASADDSTSVDPSASAATAGLGPPTSGASSGGSNADATALQPAGGSPLQSTTDDSTGLAAPSANSLQAPTTPSETLQVIQGEADGSIHGATETTTGNWDWLWLSLIFGLFVASAGVMLRTYPQLTAPFSRSIAKIQRPRTRHKSRKKVRRH